MQYKAISERFRPYLHHSSYFYRLLPNIYSMYHESVETILQILQTSCFQTFSWKCFVAFWARLHPGSATPAATPLSHDAGCRRPAEHWKQRCSAGPPSRIWESLLTKNWWIDSLCGKVTSWEGISNGVDIDGFNYLSHPLAMHSLQTRGLDAWSCNTMRDLTAQKQAFPAPRRGGQTIIGAVVKEDSGIFNMWGILFLRGFADKKLGKSKSLISFYNSATLQKLEGFEDHLWFRPFGRVQPHPAIPSCAWMEEWTMHVLGPHLFCSHTVFLIDEMRKLLRNPPRRHATMKVEHGIWN